MPPDDAERRHVIGQRVLEELKTHLGPGYLYDVDEARRLVFAAHTDRHTLDGLEAMLRIEAASEAQELFAHAGDAYLRVVVATPADFAKLEPRHNIGGRYDDPHRMLLVRQVGPELRHEFTHALHYADQHALRQRHLPWIVEGLATLYENPRVERSPDGGGTIQRMLPNQTWRLAELQIEVKRGNFIPLAGLVRMGNELFTSRANLSYDEAGCLMLYLYEHGQLRAFYDAYTAGYEQDATGRSALEHVTGLSLDTLQAHWVAWLESHAAPPAKPSPSTRP